MQRVLEVTGARSWNAAGGLKAETAGVIEVEDGRITFSHPLLASAAYRAASVHDRRAAHERLAALAADPEEHAGHIARATAAPDEAVAEAISVGARWAWQRSAPENAAELAEVAVRLTPDGSKNLYQRRIDAASYLFEAGDPDRARALLEQAVAEEPTANERAEGLWRLAKVHHHSDNHLAAVELFRRALEEAAVGGVLSVAIERDLALATMMQGDLGRAAIHARTAVDLARRAGDPILIDETATTLVLIEFLLDGHDPERLKETVVSAEVLIAGNPLALRSGSIVASVLKWTDDLTQARAHFDEEYRWARKRGADAHLPSLLWQMSDLERLAGNWQQSAAHAEEAVETAILTSSDYGLSVALSVRGRISACLGLVDDSMRDLKEGLAIAEKVSAPMGIIRNRAALGFLELSLGNHDAAHRWLSPLSEMTQEASTAEPALLGYLPDDVESLVALGRRDQAEALLDWYEEKASAAGRSSALAAASRCRATLLAADGDFTAAVGAIDRARKAYETLGLPLALGRALLTKGRILRRSKEKRASKTSLEEALKVFDELPAPLWRTKVLAELGHLGLPVSGHPGLTPTEARISRLAAAGRTNREIADEVFISAKSVEAHLSRIYAKLAIRSRAQLSTVLRAPEPPASTDV